MLISICEHLFFVQYNTIISIHKPSLGSFEVPHKIGAQPFWRSLDAHGHPDRQTDKQSVYIDKTFIIYRVSTKQGLYRCLDSIFKFLFCLDSSYEKNKNIFKHWKKSAKPNVFRKNLNFFKSCWKILNAGHST